MQVRRAWSATPTSRPGRVPHRGSAISALKNRFVKKRWRRNPTAVVGSSRRQEQDRNCRRAACAALDSFAFALAAVSRRATGDAIIVLDIARRAMRRGWRWPSAAARRRPPRIARRHCRASHWNRGRSFRGLRERVCRVQRAPGCGLPRAF